MLSEKRELRSRLQKEEVLQVLRENVQPKRTMEERFRRKKPTKYFEGTFEGNRFEIQRAINHRNSFLPKIYCSLEETSSGTKVYLKFQMLIFVIVFMAIWLGMVSLFLVFSIISYSTGDAEAIFLAIPGAMFLFGIGLVYFAYTYERNKAFTELKRLLKAQEVTSR
ncbi:hypothetical protein [Flagellimonas meridianipacifica]|uniref:Uncharacterized protein n=1 Tax=Flagellimonas meridianipacifica TaxID=1080225 RepID=A0A2T0M8D4_9FLAO|nr:hypothetical protein [Allomuricauda pacifica]PRX53735.1 hypothetical protein CLV81_2122 [Allomuricauda pacifica]